MADDDKPVVQDPEPKPDAKPDETPTDLREEGISVASTDPDDNVPGGIASDEPPKVEAKGEPADDGDDGDEGDPGEQPGDLEAAGDEGGDDAGDQPDDTDGNVDPDKPKKRRRRYSHQARVNYLLRRAYRAEAETQLLKDRLEDTEPEPDPEPSRADRAIKAIKALPTKKEDPKPPDRDDFPDVEDYLVAKAKFGMRAEFEQRLKEERLATETRLTADRDRSAASELDAAQAQELADWQAVVDKAAETIPEFDEAIDASKDVPVSDPMRDFMLGSPVGPQILFELAKNNGLADEIYGLPWQRALSAMARLETSIAPAKAQSTPRKPRDPDPKPITPLGGGSHDPGVQLDEAPYQTYARIENARHRAAGDRG